MKIQQPKKPETETKVDFLLERASILSKKPAPEIGSKIKNKPIVLDKPGPKLVKISHFFGTKVGPSIPISPIPPWQFIFSKDWSRDCLSQVIWILYYESYYITLNLISHKILSYADAHRCKISISIWSWYSVLTDCCVWIFWLKLNSARLFHTSTKCL